MTDDTDTEREWSMEDIEDTLMEINEDITSDGLDEVMLEGKIGFHIFSDNDSDSPAAGLQREMHAAFDQAIQQVFLDEDLIEEQYGEVTPQTVCAALEDQLQDFMGHGGLQEEFLAHFGQNMGVEPDHMGGRMFDGKQEPAVF